MTDSPILNILAAFACVALIFALFWLPAIACVAMDGSVEVCGL